LRGRNIYQPLIYRSASARAALLLPPLLLPLLPLATVLVGVTNSAGSQSTIIYSNA
jgi:hypothetical protein